MLVVLVGHLGQLREIRRVGLQLQERVEPPLRAGVLGADLRRVLRVVPEARGPHLRLERAEALLHLSRVKDSPRAGTSARGWRRGAAKWTDLRPWPVRIAGTECPMAPTLLDRFDAAVGDGIERAMIHHHMRRLRRHGQLKAVGAGHRRPVGARPPRRRARATRSRC